MEDFIIEYAPIAIVIIAFIFKNQIFVTPAQMEKARTEVLTTVRNEFASKEILETVKNNQERMESKIDDLNKTLLDYVLKCKNQ